MIQLCEVFADVLKLNEVLTSKMEETNISVTKKLGFVGEEEKSRTGWEAWQGGEQGQGEG